MYIDFKESIILLMEHPIMRKPLSDLSKAEQEQAYDLLLKLLNFSFDEDYTQTDPIELARLEYNLGELSYLLNKERETIIHHYRFALDSLTKGGFDLSMDKWVELVSLRTVEV